MTPNQREVDEAISYIREAMAEGLSETAQEALEQALEFLGANDEEE